MFQNPEISLDSLPAMDAVSWRPLAARHRRELVLGHVLFLGTALLGIVAGEALGFILLPLSLLPGALIYAAVHLVLATVWATLALKRKAYALRQRDILYRSGVVWRRITALPFNRIQHVETTSGVLERLLGLASIVIYTAGGTGGDLKIHGLEAADAERLREYILGRAARDDETNDAESPGPDAEDDAGG